MIDTTLITLGLALVACVLYRIWATLRYSQNMQARRCAHIQQRMTAIDRELDVLDVKARKRPGGWMLLDMERERWHSLCNEYDRLAEELTEAKSRML